VDTNIICSIFPPPAPSKRGALNVMCPPLAGELKGVVEMCPHNRINRDLSPKGEECSDESLPSGES